MNIVVDYREAGLIDQFNSMGITFETRNLVLGDILLEQEGNEIILFERKTLDDLASSIVDGRYKEQSCRLSEHGICKHHILYLLEGSLTKFHQSPWKSKSITKHTLISAMTSLFYYKGFSVMRTENKTETAELIVGMRDKLIKENKPPYIEKPIDIDYVSTVKSVKKDNITPDNIDVLMLSQIPYVSTTIASLLLDGRTLEVFIQECKQDPTILDTRTYKTSTDKERKFSKKVIDNVKTFLKII